MQNNRQAILITAYKNFEYLLGLVKKISSFFDVYIHIDKKASYDETIIEQIKDLGCIIIQEYSINWGAFNHLKAIISLLRIASEKEYSYYHIISGEDYPVKPFSFFLDFFSNNDRIYISINRAKDTIWEERYRYYYIFKNHNPHSFLIHHLNNISIRFQKIIRIRRTRIGSFGNIYKGYVYGSLPKDAVNYLLLFVSDNPIFMRQLSYTFIPEEFFFQTVLGNSYLKDRIADDCLRYSVWEYKNGSIPGYLDLSDYPAIIEGNYLFARKMNNDVSAKLIAILDKNTEERL